MSGRRALLPRVHAIIGVGEIAMTLQATTAPDAFLVLNNVTRQYKAALLLGECDASPRAALHDN